MKAIIIGSTGATGKEVIKQLLEDERFDAVTAFTRRTYFAPHPKLKEIIIDFENLMRYRDDIRGDVAFSCLGTTLKDAGSKEAQWRVDHDYQLEFARIARKNSVGSFVLLSAVGANPKSGIFYNRLKGILESDVKELVFDQLLILQPGGIKRPNTKRGGEKLMMTLLSGFNLFGIFKAYAPISTNRLAKAMIASVFKFQGKRKVISLKEIKAII